MIYRSTFLWLVLFTIFINAKSLDVYYKINFGLLGEVGIAQAHLVTNANSYIITIQGEATGMARILSRGRKEIHTSRGYIKNGLLVPNEYKVTKLYGKKHTQKIYTIDHKAKTVTKSYGKFPKKLNFYSKNDLLTLYFNLNSIIKDKYKESKYSYQAVGAEKQNGVVNIIIPSNSKVDNYWHFTAIIYQKNIFK